MKYFTKIIIKFNSRLKFDPNSIADMLRLSNPLNTSTFRGMYPSLME